MKVIKVFIVGQQKTTLNEYPGKICTMYFFAYCNFRCPYCHNAHVVDGIGDVITEDQIIPFIRERKGFIDAVCISGGEPTLHSEVLYELIKKLKNEDLLIKLDSNGTNPFIIKRLADEHLVDYFAMDIKAPFDKYELVTRSKVDVNNIKSSINIIRNSKVDYEFRTTVCKELHTKQDIIEIAEYIKGSRRYFIQNYRELDTVHTEKGSLHPLDIKVLEEIKHEIGHYFDMFKIR